MCWTGHKKQQRRKEGLNIFSVLLQSSCLGAEQELRCLGTFPKLGHVGFLTLGEFPVSRSHTAALRMRINLEGLFFGLGFSLT